MRRRTLLKLGLDHTILTFAGVKAGDFFIFSKRDILEPPLFDTVKYKIIS